MLVLRGVLWLQTLLVVLQVVWQVGQGRIPEEDLSRVCQMPLLVQRVGDDHTAEHITATVGPQHQPPTAVHTANQCYRPYRANEIDLTVALPPLAHVELFVAKRREPHRYTQKTKERREHRHTLFVVNTFTHLHTRLACVTFSSIYIGLLRTPTAALGQLHTTDRDLPYIRFGSW